MDAAGYHYRRALELLDRAQKHTTENPADMRIADVLAARAQVHATLATVPPHIAELREEAMDEQRRNRAEAAALVGQGEQ